MRRHPSAVLGAFVLAAAVAAPALAQPQKDGAARQAQQVQRLTQDKRALETERTRLAAENADLEQKLRRADGARAGAERRLAGQVGDLRKELATEKDRAAAAEKALADARAELKARDDRLAALQAQAAEQQAAAQRAQAQLAARLQVAEARGTGLDGQLATCGSHNVRLVALVDELGLKYRDKSCADAMAQREPFLATRRVQIENLVEQYRDKAGAERFVATPAATAPASVR